MRVLFVDNYDSFAYNVVHLLAAAGAEPDLIRSDDPRLRADVLDRYALLAIGPGPGNPSQQPQMMGVLRAALDRGFPIFGVCLGLQAIGEACGARVVHAPSQMHGKTSAIVHDGSSLFEGIPQPLRVTRYHSLCLQAPLPTSLRATAHAEDGTVQAIEHVELPVAGVQFHPESILSDSGLELTRNALRLARR